MQVGAKQVRVDGRFIGHEMFEPGREALEVFVSARKHARLDQHLPDVVDSAAIGQQFVEKFVTDGSAIAGQFRQEISVRAVGDPLDCFVGIGHSGERVDDGLQLRLDRVADVGEECIDAVGEYAVGADVGAVGVASAATAATGDAGAFVAGIAATADRITGVGPLALRALSTEPFFAKGMETANGDILWVGKPTSKALRVAGQRPSAETLLDRLIDSLETAGEDEARVPEERSMLKQVALGLRTAAAQIAISALGGAGGNLLSG
jgi:hypothetical protein